MTLRSYAALATSVFVLNGCAADAPVTSTAEDGATSAPAASAAAPLPASAGATTASAVPSASTPASAVPSRKPFTPDQVFVRVWKGQIKIIQMWQRNEGQKDKQTNMAAADVCSAGKQMMGWVVDSGQLHIETEAAAAPGALPAKDTYFRFDREDSKPSDAVEGRVEIVSIETKPARAGSFAARGKVKVFAKDAAGQLVDGTFDATVCIDVPSST
ncbi:MAG: hypothetical protein HOV80_04375 [Polyangiaceae bacterium]|nr:hypothetical protein [Polyangiaceae bacterium]